MNNQYIERNKITNQFEDFINKGNKKIFYIESNDTGGVGKTQCLNNLKNIESLNDKYTFLSSIDLSENYFWNHETLIEKTYEAVSGKKKDQVNLHELVSLIEKHHANIVICLDTAEVLAEKIEIHSLIKFILDIENYVHIVVAGRINIFNKNKSILEKTYQATLSNFNKTECKEFIKNIEGLTETININNVISYTNGSPLFLSLFSGVYSEDSINIDVNELANRREHIESLINENYSDYGKEIFKGELLAIYANKRSFWGFITLVYSVIRLPVDKHTWESLLNGLSNDLIIKKLLESENINLNDSKSVEQLWKNQRKQPWLRSQNEDYFTLHDSFSEAVEAYILDKFFDKKYINKLWVLASRSFKDTADNRGFNIKKDATRRYLFYKTLHNPSSGIASYCKKFDTFIDDKETISAEYLWSDFSQLVNPLENKAKHYNLSVAEKNGTLKEINDIFINNKDFLIHTMWTLNYLDSRGRIHHSTLSKYITTHYERDIVERFYSDSSYLLAASMHRHEVFNRKSLDLLKDSIDYHNENSNSELSDKLCLYAYTLWLTGDYDNSEKYIFDALKSLFNKNKAKIKDLLTTLIRLLLIKSHGNRAHDALYIANIIDELAQENEGNTLGLAYLAHTYRARGELFRITRDFSRAYECNNKAVNLYKKLKDESNKGECIVQNMNVLYDLLSDSQKLTTVNKIYCRNDLFNEFDELVQKSDVYFDIYKNDIAAKKLLLQGKVNLLKPIKSFTKKINTSIALFKAGLHKANINEQQIMENVVALNNAYILLTLENKINLHDKCLDDINKIYKNNRIKNIFGLSNIIELQKASWRLLSALLFTSKETPKSVLKEISKVYSSNFLYILLGSSGSEGPNGVPSGFDCLKRLLLKLYTEYPKEIEFIIAEIHDAWKKPQKDGVTSYNSVDYRFSLMTLSFDLMVSLKNKQHSKAPILHKKRFDNLINKAEKFIERGHWNASRKTYTDAFLLLEFGDLDGYLKIQLNFAYLESLRGNIHDAITIINIAMSYIEKIENKAAAYRKMAEVYRYCHNYTFSWANYEKAVECTESEKVDTDFKNLLHQDMSICLMQAYREGLSLSFKGKKPVSHTHYKKKIFQYMDSSKKYPTASSCLQLFREARLFHQLDAKKLKNKKETYSPYINRYKNALSCSWAEEDEKSFLFSAISLVEIFLERWINCGLNISDIEENEIENLSLNTNLIFSDALQDFLDKNMNSFKNLRSQLKVSLTFLQIARLHSKQDYHYLFDDRTSISEKLSINLPTVFSSSMSTIGVDATPLSYKTWLKVFSVLDQPLQREVLSTLYKNWEESNDLSLPHKSLLLTFLFHIRKQARMI